MILTVNSSASTRDAIVVYLRQQAEEWDRLREIGGPGVQAEMSIRAATLRFEAIRIADATIEITP